MHNSIGKLEASDNTGKSKSVSDLTKMFSGKEHESLRSKSIDNIFQDKLSLKSTDKESTYENQENSGEMMRTRSKTLDGRIYCNIQSNSEIYANVLEEEKEKKKKSRLHYLQTFLLKSKGDPKLKSTGPKDSKSKGINQATLTASTKSNHGNKSKLDRLKKNINDVKVKITKGVTETYPRKQKTVVQNDVEGDFLYENTINTTENAMYINSQPVIPSIEHEYDYVTQIMEGNSRAKTLTSCPSEPEYEYMSSQGLMFEGEGGYVTMS